ncbi:MAG: RNA polymerase sigma factor [Lachnospiraceae bacterium]|nr:RNA polymerase sigma factor [Lachnospiraceae bacterium]MBR5766691.1 RNA polymerase sigma factor [Lachnospiraceae bacterium]
MPTDSELYNRYLRGDESAIDELMIRYGDRLTVFLNGYLHNWHDAEDLTIEAFARIAVKKPNINEGVGTFRAYLFKTARNLAARHRSLGARMEVFSLDGMEAELSGGGELEGLMQDKERQQAVRLCLERIDARLKEVLWLVYVEDLSYKDAAKIMGVNKKRIDNLLIRAKEHMRRELDREGISQC